MPQSKKDLAACRVSLQAHHDDNNKDINPVPPAQVGSALTLVPVNTISIDNNNNNNNNKNDNLDNEKVKYANAPINSNH